MPKPQYDIDHVIANSEKRVDALFQTYRHKKDHFTSIQGVGDNISWTVFDNVLRLRYAHYIRDAEDIVYETIICNDFMKCYLTDKKIKEIVKWFTKNVNSGKHVDIYKD